MFILLNKVKVGENKMEQNEDLKKIIIEKTKKFLQEHKSFKEESEIIYLLVQIRKILELERSKPYKTLYFYCNWVLHSKLNRPSTTKFLADIFDQSIDLNGTAHQNARNIKNVGKEFFTVKTFKNELGSFLRSIGLPQRFSNERLLLEIIKDCPIELATNKIKRVKVIKHSNKEYHYKFHIIDKKINQ